MLNHWKWVLRLKIISWIVGFKVGKRGYLVANRFLLLRVTIWVLLSSFSAYSLVVEALSNEVFGCYNSVMHDTFKLYNVTFVMLGNSVIGFLTNVFCFCRLNCRDIATLINKSIAWHKRVTYALGQWNEKSDRQLNFLIFHTYVWPFLMSVYLSIDCSGEEVLSQFSWTHLLVQWLMTLASLPAPAITTVFFLTMESVNRSLGLISQQINIIVVSKSPKIFLEVAPLNCTRFQDNRSFNARYVYSLRKIHDETVLFTDEVMQFFQADILSYFVLAFYNNILLNYAIVINGVKLFQSKEITKFMCINIVFVLGLMVNLWALCAGPSRIQDKIKMFQLQSRNHKSSFEVFGMFKLNYSLLFTMCASITSYIVVLIQFTIDSQSTAGWPGPSNTTVNATLNIETANTTMLNSLNTTTQNN